MPFMNTGRGCGWVRSCALVTMLSLASSAICQTTGSPKTYPVAALQQDLAFLKAKLSALHPALDMYTSAERLESCFDSLGKSIQQPLTELQFLSTIAALYPLLGDGHTLFLPGTDDQGRSYLPLNVTWLDEHLFITANGTSDEHLNAGREITRINGTPVASIMDTLLMHQIRDGRNTTYPRWIINNYFKEYYRFSFGEPPTFTIELKSERGFEKVVVGSLTSDSIRANINRNASPGMIANRSSGITMRFEKGDSVAVLTIPTFETKTLKSEYGQNAKREVMSTFAMMREHKTRKLILDLRGNQGGDPSLGKLLLSYLLDEPFTLVSKGPASGTSKPHRGPFTGQLVVLMDGGCFSVTGMVLSCLERDHRATFIGEEAGGNRTVISGSPKHVRLPNTGIDCYISTRLWRLTDGPNDGHGVMPTIAVRATIEDLLSGRDAVMDVALKALE
ncbi:MAG: hypothetical protein IPP83_05235 [Flavobacteriales bacterium]|nr:hypothetical protein [Flavobacteriales bacterium]